MTGRRIYTIWDRAKVFKDYSKPPEDHLVKIVDGIKVEIFELRKKR